MTWQNLVSGREILGMRNAALRVLVAVAAGIALHRLFPSVPWWCAAAVALLAGALAWFTSGLTLYVALTALAFLHARAQMPAQPDRAVYAQAGFRGTVVEEPLRAGDRMAAVEFDRSGHGKVRVWPRGPGPALRYGDVVEVRSPIQPLDFPRNPGLVDFNQVLLARGYVGSASAGPGELAVVARGHGSPLMRVVVAPLRRYVFMVISRYLPEAEGALLAGLLVGGRQGLPREVQDAFTDAGIVHIIAVSGTNVSIVVGVVWLLLSILGVRGWWRFGLGAASVVLYVALVGWSAAPARSGLMACVVLLSVPTQRRAWPLAGLAAVATALLLFAPAMLFDTGAQLSFAATLGIILAVGLLDGEWVNRTVSQRLRKWLMTPLAVSLAATAATAPLMLHHFYRFQPLAFLTSLVVVPLVAVAMPLGLVVLVANLVSSSLAGYFAQALWAVLYALLKLTTFMGGLRWAIVETGRLSWLWVAWLYGLGLLAVNWKRHWVMPTLAAFALAGLCLMVWRPAFERQETSVVFLDPGQGDAALLTDTLGRHVLVDAGINGRNVLRDYLRSRGIHRLDAVIVTHPDNDHYGGLLDLGSRIRVDRLLVPTTASRDTGYLTLLDRLRQAGTDILVVDKGAELTGFGFGIRFVWPDAATRGQYARDMARTNDVSLVTRVEHARYVMLLTGDMDDPELLVAESLRADLLKSPHHGSRKGNPQALFEAVRPSTVVVMGRYPTPARLEERFAGTPVDYVNTRRDGALVLRFKSGRPVFQRFGSYLR